MDITKLERNKLILAGLFGLVAGLTIGLVYGYVINPLEWVDASMELTRNDLQEDYLRMAIDSYKLYMDPAGAIDRWQELGESAPEILTKISASPGTQGIEAINNYKKVVLPPVAGPVDLACEECTPESNNSLCVFLWLGTVTFVGVLGIYFYYRTQGVDLRRSVSRAPKTKDQTYEEIIPFITDDSNPPLVHSMTTFVLGDDLFDESFSIDTTDGEFLGECGIGIVNTLGNGTPKRVNAFDVWLFDKNEINTQSTVLMSGQAYEDDILRTQLETKGIPMMAEIGREISMETSHLQMRVRIVDMVCEEGDPGKCATFQRLSLELLVRQLD